MGFRMPRRRILLVSIGLAGALGVVSLYVLTREDYELMPSPSGNYTLKLIKWREHSANGVVWPFVKMQILDARGRKVYVHDHDFAAWLGLSFCWDRNDRAWVDSSDIGVYYWERGQEGWVQHSWEGGGGIDRPARLGRDELSRPVTRK